MTQHQVLHITQTKPPYVDCKHPPFLFFDIFIIHKLADTPGSNPVLEPVFVSVKVIVLEVSVECIEVRWLANWTHK